jgi:hypothetical protein
MMLPAGRNTAAALNRSDRSEATGKTFAGGRQATDADDLPEGGAAVTPAAAASRKSTALGKAG